jgi:hypothetical protein
VKACPYCQGGTFAPTRELEIEMSIRAAGDGQWNLRRKIKALQAENEALRADLSVIAIRASRLAHFIALDSIADGAVKK